MFTLSFTACAFIVGCTIFYYKKRPFTAPVEENAPVQVLDPVICQILEAIENNGLKFEKELTDASTKSLSGANDMIYSINGFSRFTPIKVILTPSGGTKVELNGYLLNELCTVSEWERFVSPRISAAMSAAEEKRLEQRKNFIRHQVHKIFEESKENETKISE